MANSTNTSESTNTIFETSITWNWIEEKLKCALQTNSRFGSKKKAIRIGSGQGFMSFVGRLHLDWVPTDESLPQTVIIKIPTIENARQLVEGMNATGELEKAGDYDLDGLLAKFEPMLQRVHNTEVSFYEMISSSDLHIKVPQTYILQKFTKDFDQGFIVMADQGEDSIILSLFNNITIDEIMQVFDALAELHAYSLTNPECFTAIIPTSLTDLFRIHDQKTMHRGLLKATQNLDETKLVPLIEEVEKDLDEILDPEIVERLHKEMGMKPVLSHGDLWASNIIWNKDGERNILAAIVDWQLIHPGTPSEDIARLMSSSLSAKDRREQLDVILERYYKKLTEYLQTEPPFTFEQLKKSFIRIYPFAMVGIPPGLGPLMQMQIKDKSDDEKKKLKEVMCEKAIGLYEDILYYNNLNKLNSI